jgi:hypothetical protein
MIGGLDTQLVHEFFQGFVNHAGVTLHIDNLKGVNAHHQVETIFKAFGRALRMALTLDPRAAGQSRPPRAFFKQNRPPARVFLARAAMNSRVNQTVAVVDYGMGNLRSVAQAVMHATQDTHVNAVITADPAQVRAAHRVVLPGQGAMPDCMRELRESGLLESVLEAAATKPLFGVCVGMQMLLEHSAEGRRPAPAWA